MSYLTHQDYNSTAYYGMKYIELYSRSYLVSEYDIYTDRFAGLSGIRYVGICHMTGKYIIELTSNYVGHEHIKGLGAIDRPEYLAEDVAVKKKLRIDKEVFISLKK